MFSFTHTEPLYRSMIAYFFLMYFMDYSVNSVENLEDLWNLKRFLVSVAVALFIGVSLYYGEKRRKAKIEADQADI